MPIPIDHLIQTRRKTIALIIQSDGSLMVRAPIRMSTVRIQEFVQSHAVWIRKKQAGIKISPTLPKKRFVAGETFVYLGKEYPLTVVAHQRRALIFNGSRFQLASLYVGIARQAFIRWYKSQALAVISERIVLYAKQNGHTFRKIRISSARTRWGSCSANGTLSFTWRLVMAPLEVIDYVVVHELVHTQIHSHSPKFWHRVGEIMPQYKQYVSWLKKTGRFLTLGD